MKANCEGIVYVISQMDWYWNLPNLLRQESIVEKGTSAGVRFELEKRIIDLYKVLLIYQMKSICSYYRNQNHVFLQDIIWGRAPRSRRTNEYFVPKDGIDREVISADITRYLGSDALVRPGVYEVRSQLCVEIVVET